MDAAHHLARQIVEGRDIKLEGREGDADPIGERAPPARAEAFRKTVLEIIELDLDGRFAARCLQHRYDPNRPAFITLHDPPSPSCRGLSGASTIFLAWP